jgi:hypothetical protein
MEMYTNAEYADIHFVYGFCDGNAAAAAREYQLYPDWRHPERRVFEAVHRRLRDRFTQTMDLHWPR